MSVSTQSHLLNISWEVKNEARVIRHVQEGFIGNCLFVNVANGLDGILFPTDGIRRMRVQNSTFDNCSGNCPTGRKTYSTGAIEISDCPLISINSSEEERGGAIYVSGNASCTIKRCLFDRCQIGASNNSGKGNGGAMFVASSALSFTGECNFTNCVCGYTGTACASLSLAFDHCRFENGSGQHYGGIDYQPQLNGTYLSDAVFLNNKAVNHGGAMFLSGGNFIVSVLSNCLFRGNAAGTHSGVMLSTYGKETFEIILKFHFWESNQDKQGCSGWNIDQTFIGKIVQGNFVKCYSYNMNGIILLINRPGYGDKSEWIPSPSSFNETFISSEYGDDEFSMCGHAARECKTLGFVVGKLGDSFRKSPIYVKRGEYIEGPLNIGVKSVEIYGEMKERTILKMDKISVGNSLFIVGCGSLNITDFTFIPEICSSSFSSTLFHVSEGKCNICSCVITNPSSMINAAKLSTSVVIASSGRTILKDCIFKEMKFEACPCFQFSEPKCLRMESVNFDAIIRESGSGSIIECNLEELQILSVNNITVNRCQLLNGNGGGIYVKLCEGSLMNIGNESKAIFDKCVTPTDATLKGKGGGIYLELDTEATDFVLDEVEFGSSNSAWKGRNIFLSAISLTKVVDSSHFVSCISLDRNKDDEAMGFNCEINNYPIPLSFYLMPFHPSPAYVGGSNSLNFDQCGFSGYPCSTICFAVNLRFKQVKRDILLNEEFVWNEIVEMNGFEWNIHSGVKGNKVKVSSNENALENGMITVSKKTTITNISFVLCSSLSDMSVAFITCMANEIHIVDCSVIPLSSSANYLIQYSFITGIGGKIKLSSFEQSGCLTMNQYALISICNQCSLECSLCMFGGLKRKVGNGGCIEVCGSGGDSERRREFVIDASMFCNCSVEEEGSCGGGVFAELNGEEKLIINSTSAFEKCCAPSLEENKGKGGGIMITVNEVSSTFSIGSRVNFSESIPNEAFVGKNVFVSCGSGLFLKDKINVSSLSFFDVICEPMDIFEMTGIEDGRESPLIPLHVFLCSLQTTVIIDGGFGIDHSHCGFASFPCLSVDFCAKQKLSANVNQMIIVASSIINDEISITLFQVSLSSTAESIHVTVADEGAETKNTLIDCSQNFVISNLTFDLPESIQELHTNFISSSVFISLTCCCFAFSSEYSGATIEYCAIEVKEGDIEMKEITVDPAVLFNAFSFITFDSVHSAMISNSTYSGLNRANGDGGCILMNELVGNEPFVQIINCSFSSSCYTGKGLKGGGMMMSLFNGGKLSILETYLNGCTVPESDNEDNGKGLGGGLFIKFLDDSCALELDKLNFLSCNAWRGHNIFVYGNILYNLITTSAFKFTFDNMDSTYFMGYEKLTTDEQLPIPLELYFQEFGNEGYVGGKGDLGFDHSGCGFENYPCRTIPFLISLRFAENTLTSNIVLHSSFVFEEVLVLEMFDANIRVRTEGTEIAVSSEGECGGDGLIETRNRTSVNGISFSVPQSFAHAQRKSLLLCSKGILTLTDCSMKSATSESTICFAACVGGQLILINCRLSLFEFCEASAIKVQGRESISILNGLELNNVQKDGRQGLIQVTDGAYVEMIYSKISGPQPFGNHGVLTVDQLSTLTVKKTNFSLLTRETESGAVIVCEVGSGNRMELTECSFSTIACLSANTKGGAFLANIYEGGVLVFEKNSVESCKVNKINGLGGGLHLTFQSANVDYTMRENKFIGNDAYLGYDVYLVCPTPRLAVDKNKWTGSAEEEQDDKTLWAIDPEFPSGNDTIMKYLFGHPDSIIYVNTEQGFKNECGTEDMPCYELSYGFEKMIGEKDTLAVIESCKLDGEIVRETNPMTISGKGENGSSLTVGEFGHLVMEVGTDLSRITIERIRFSLPVSSSFEELVSVRVGTVYFVKCIFCGSTDAPIHTNMMLIRGCGGSTQFDNVEVSYIEFFEGKGVAMLKRGSFSIINATIEHISSSGCILDCGELSKMNVKNQCSFVDCASHDDGGALKCSLIENGEMSIQNCSICKCSAIKSNSKGGGIFLNLQGDSTPFFSFQEVRFSQNEAIEGNDIFLACFDLNSTVTKERFDILLENEIGTAAVDMKGMDTLMFDKSIDLLLFLIQGELETSFISPDGYDIIGCGKSEYPCRTFWRGFKNLKTDISSKEIRIKQSCMIKDSFDVSCCFIKSDDVDKFASIVFSEGINTGARKAIFQNSDILKFEWIAFDQLALISNEQLAMILNIGVRSKLKICNCTLNGISNEMKIKSTFVSSNGGSVELSDVCVRMFVCELAMFSLSSQTTMKNCSFESVSQEKETEGGVVQSILEDGEELLLDKVQASTCACTTPNGKGGFMNLNCSLAVNKNPFLLKSTYFSSNNATLGKNMFIASFNLNSSITLSTFAFDFDEMKDDRNLFVGSDKNICDTDLFRFLVEYKNETVFISSTGYDVARCGSNEDPCKTLWKGLRQSSDVLSSGDKIIFVILSAFVRESFDLSGYVIESATSVSEEYQKKSIVKVERKQDGENVVIKNQRNFTIRMIALVAEEAFMNEVGSIILNENGIVKLEDCCFETRGTVENNRYFSFVLIEKGELQALKLLLSQGCLGKSIIRLERGCICDVNEFGIVWTEISEECVISFYEGNKANEEAKTLLRITNSSVNSLSGRNSIPCVIKSNSASQVGVEINNTTLEMCKASASVKGGVGFINLDHGGDFSMRHCKVIQCGCNNDEGRGGGLYLATDENGTMNFVLQNSTFKGNNAKIGNDIFIECVSIFDQINETQFRMDLRDGAFNRINAIWGVDRNANSPVDLMDYITVHQADTIIVSSASGKLGRNERQCGTRDLPCLSLDYALTHLTSDLESRLLIDTEGLIAKEMQLVDVALTSRSGNGCTIFILNGIEMLYESLIQVYGNVSMSGSNFPFNKTFSSTHQYLISVESELLTLKKCSLFAQKETDNEPLPLCLTLLCVRNGWLVISEFVVGDFCFSSSPIIRISPKISHVIAEKLKMNNIILRNGSAIQFNESFSYEKHEREEASSSFQISASTFENITQLSERAIVIEAEFSTGEINLVNCSSKECVGEHIQGSVASFGMCREVVVELCTFDGKIYEHGINETNEKFNEICGWNSSMIEFCKTSAHIKDTILSNSSHGAMLIKGGELKVEKVEFSNNNPRIEIYPSFRRNLACTDNASVALLSIKGGDGLFPNSSMWILNDGCDVSGIASERLSSFFIPELKSIEMEEMGTELSVKFKGKLLLPCNLSFMVVKQIVDEKQIEKHGFGESGYVSETEVEGRLSKETIIEAGEGVEVSVNAKKEMVIGTLQEREQTAAQILFWVANLALHSFENEEDELSSLANLSPHIVLFSEHMVICIVMHSDLLSDDSSSSISSSTVVTSASDDDDDSLPSSAFEDDEDNRKECLKWKAPELLINKKMDATKESVAFSIGMMLWECLTLQIPFGEYEAEVAGQKIVNGERPSVEIIGESSLKGCVISIIGSC
ncbi:uncharacterized protein MONOS_15164 [Monocercomonoides exilis]|uniref:uncharacterized protein n=1 Tax=Monocercomonoides exilis TaxID=2049356 RepID=UPI00355A8A21|nr:hypothetical protein MONOS_15164 [Monocercomonoides exilis]|eukprot:MONOS_15164.1-p1 / transcript=MONOS_15164.1 / gene=MONOS_15164 / organism=Monocercomonoides_exilis_PA203 / gene_product=unspecified product / transcript_product=unspecified product / location=Mono_scaffold01160:2109-13801(-) / protein_length=3466 / sequence_SO=supercontig / SO=protein_coding / is_pseudo=false